MGNVIRLTGDRHRETLLLLPWYVIGQLDEPDLRRVEAHLAGCAKCRAELRLEQTLDRAVAGLPLGVEQGWTAMRRRIEAEPKGHGGAVRVLGATVVAGASRVWRAGGPWLRWAVAGAAAAVVVAGPSPRPLPAAAYRALGAAPSNTAGNVIVIFRDDASARAIRQALAVSNARIVDGPTAADSYVLRVPVAGRERALAALKSSGVAQLAEPIDGGTPP